jgi:cystathionine gamma-synthase
VDRGFKLKIRKLNNRISNEGGVKTDEKKYSEASEVLYKGHKVKGMDFNKPVVSPLFPSVSFTMNTLKEVKEAYASKYTYIRTNNPNRDALAEVVTFLEYGEDSLIFSSEMPAISTTLFTILEPSDHIICNRNIYGETFDIMGKLMNKFGIETDFVNFDDVKNVKNAIKSNTKLIYSEVCANPTMNLGDVTALAEISHANGALLMIDNTFTTPVAIKPLDLGADVQRG